MRLVFKTIPKLARYFYIVGFAVILTALGNYFSATEFINTLLMQQLFIGGAIIVAVGSVINTLFQFKKKD